MHSYLVSFLDALANVMASQGALQRPPANQLGISGPPAQAQRHIVHIDQLKARSTNDSAEQASSVLWQADRPRCMSVEDGAGQRDGHIHVDVTDLCPLHKVPGSVAAVTAHELHGERVNQPSCITKIQGV